MIYKVSVRHVFEELVLVRADSFEEAEDWVGETGMHGCVSEVVGGRYDTCVVGTIADDEVKPNQTVNVAGVLTAGTLTIQEEPTA